MKKNFYKSWISLQNLLLVLIYSKFRADKNKQQISWKRNLDLLIQDLMNKIRNVLIKKTHNNSAHCAYLTRPRRIKKEASWCGVCDILPNILWQCYYPKKKWVLQKKKEKKITSKRNTYWLDISCLIHDSFVTRRLLYDFCESEYKKKFCVIVLCFYKLRKNKQKKTAKTTTNVVLKEGDSGGSGGLLKKSIICWHFCVFLGYAASSLSAASRDSHYFVVL